MARVTARVTARVRARTRRARERGALRRRLRRSLSSLDSYHAAGVAAASVPMPKVRIYG